MTGHVSMYANGNGSCQRTRTEAGERVHNEATHSITKVQRQTMYRDGEVHTTSTPSISLLPRATAPPLTTHRPRERTRPLALPAPATDGARLAAQNAASAGYVDASTCCQSNPHLRPARAPYPS